MTAVAEIDAVLIGTVSPCIQTDIRNSTLTATVMLHCAITLIGQGEIFNHKPFYVLKMDKSVTDQVNSKFFPVGFSDTIIFATIQGSITNALKANIILTVFLLRSFRCSANGITEDIINAFVCLSQETVVQ